MGLIVSYSLDLTAPLRPFWLAWLPITVLAGWPARMLPLAGWLAPAPVCPACPAFVYFYQSLSLIPRSGEGAPPTWIEPETCRPPASACVPNQQLQKTSILSTRR